MLFDAKQFEQFFKERTLKRGLKLFEKGLVDCVDASTPPEYRFIIAGKELLLRKRGDKLMAYSCSCGDQSFCEHLAASLFFFQQDDLGLRVKKKAPLRPVLKKAKVPTKRSSAKNLIHPRHESLVQFINQNRNKLSAKEILGFFPDKTLELFDVFCLQLELLLEPFIQLRSLNQKNCDALKTTIASFIKRNTKAGERNEYYLHLAIVRQFMPLFNLRFTGNEIPLFKLREQAMIKLEKALENGLSKTQQSAWYKTTVVSLDNNKYLTGETFAFLIPHCVCMPMTQADFQNLTRLMAKKSYRTPYTQHLNLLQIAKLEVALMENRVYKTALPFDPREMGIELLIAEAELAFCRGKSDQAFELLESKLTFVKSNQLNYYGDYLNYIVLNAKKKRRADLERKYLRESFLSQLYIQPKSLDRFLKLVPKNGWQEEILGLVKKLKMATLFYSFDKIAMLLLKGSFVEELIAELKKQNNKFAVVHDVALLKFPDYDKSFLQLYVKHLQEALIENDVYNHQILIFNKAKTYFDLLPEDLVDEMIKGIMDRIGRSRPIYRYINELQGFPFLREDGIELNLPAKKQLR